MTGTSFRAIPGVLRVRAGGAVGQCLSGVYRFLLTSHCWAEQSWIRESFLEGASEGSHPVGQADLVGGWGPHQGKAGLLWKKFLEQL